MAYPCHWKGGPTHYKHDLRNMIAREEPIIIQDGSGILEGTGTQIDYICSSSFRRYFRTLGNQLFLLFRIFEGLSKMFGEPFFWDPSGQRQLLHCWCHAHIHVRALSGGRLEIHIHLAFARFALESIPELLPPAPYQTHSRFYI